MKMEKSYEGKRVLLTEIIEDNFEDQRIWKSYD